MTGDGPLDPGVAAGDVDAADAEDGEGPPEIDEGRYLYCVVSVDEGSPVEAFEATGVSDAPVSLVTDGGIAAVVHPCEEVYDSADLGRVRRWLVRHQSVVDDAGEAFGTPIPFQFDTILRGDDEAVEEWLAAEGDRLRELLASLAGHWEYRVEVVERDPPSADRLEETDEELADLRERIDGSGEGTGFLMEKQYEKRVETLREHRRAELTADLADRLAEHTREIHELDRSPAADLAEGSGREREGETICRLTLLVAEEREEAVGAALDPVADREGIEVRFTGPWPPYTFVPELGGGEE
ncbi:gas vesicle protein GvpL [Saliphagus sp. LR7]|uniref:gas vesicle protein GvpL n=1 Tax=Saliphagus sp. LR7 TaxID=2282654 RepID=UPI003743C89D